ncbi:major paralogous domain-containing protein [Fibrobacter sp. UWR3]|nr:major paralogous domain-containing protein [Fibrobacter sp. UWR3]
MKKSFQRVIATLNLFQGKQSLTIFLLAAMLAFSACDDSSSASSDETGVSSSSVESSDSSVTLSPSTSSGQAPESAESNGSSDETKDKSSSSENMSSSSAKETKNSSDSKSSSSVKSGDSSSSNKDKSSSSEKQSSSSSVNQSSSTIFSSSGEYIPFDHSLPLLADSVRSGAYKIYEDSRDGQKYYYLTINGKRKDGTRGSVTIFAQNLNYGVQIDGTENQNDDNKVEKYCYENDWIRCDEYGGLYQWAEAMGLPSECNTKSCANLISNPSNHQGICPNGWRLMTYDDYELIYWSTDKGALGIRSQYTFKGSNYTGFSLVGAGYRCSGCSKGFEGRLGIAGWYYPTEIDKNKKLSTSEEFDRSNVFASVGYSYDNKDDLTPNTARSDSKLWGLSIRCVMANQE